MFRRRRAARKTAGGSLDATRARVLDGRHVWITLDAPSEGELVARWRGETASLGVSVVPGAQTVCLPLADLPGDEEGGVPLLVRTGGRDLPLVLVPGPVLPTRAPTAPGSPWRYDVPAGGELEVRRARVPDTVAVASVGVDERGLLVAWAGSGGTRLVLLDEDGSPRSELATATADGVAVGVLQADLDCGPPGSPVPLGVWDGSGPARPLVRALGAMRQPNKAVAMPVLDRPDGHRLALRWSGADGFLQVVAREVGR